MSSKQLAILIAVVVVVVAGILVFRQHDGSDATAQNQTPPPAQEVTPPPTVAANNCTRNFDREKLASEKLDIVGKMVVLDVQGFGSIKVDLYPADAPKTVENFLRLVNAGFYDCLTFHRVSRGFVIQGGDPSGNGTGGESAFGATFADELNPETASYKAGYVKGVLAMANRGANTNSSQFFIMIGDVPLPHAYTIFGKVVEGQDVADKIGQVPIIPNLQMNPQGTDGAPKDPVVVTKATIISK